MWMGMAMIIWFMPKEVCSDLVGVGGVAVDDWVYDL